MTYSALKKLLRATIGLDAVLGLWLFISPWVFGAYSSRNAWDNWVVGAIIAILAAMQFSDRTSLRMFAIVIMVLGAWTCVSPWVYRYVDQMDRFVNNLSVGALLFVINAYVTKGPGRTISDKSPQTPSSA